MKSVKVIIAFFFLSFLLLPHTSQAQESKFKALFLYKFAEYVEWPSGNGNLVIGVVDSPDILKYLTEFAMKKPNLSVINVKAVGESSKCNIIFLPKNKDKEVAIYQKQIGYNSILLVTENSKLTGKGADIGFYIEAGKLRFMLSEKDIRSKKMVPNSKLLALGKSI